MYSNDALSMLKPLKKISIYRILQIIAKDEVEKNCHEFINCFLKNYQLTEDNQLKSPKSWNIEISENSSIEIYRALTKHIILPRVSTTTIDVLRMNVSSLFFDINYSTILSNNLETVVKNHRNQSDEIIKVAASLSRKYCSIKNEHKDYRDCYQRIVWASVSGMLDHVVLWWSHEGLAISNSRDTHHLKNWLHRFLQSPDSKLLE
ncbi:uncharacterized protein LOC122853846 [Aphidius gifuensis]|uniref:uncharacterized protein LOC122853846 n=1 Tax=Aphidius gifuensis TaxID=684658 RepID=UPI001CDBB9BA|nr:uncharacterized protein LOC122853846 [Aphidius gifuensis]